MGRIINIKVEFELRSKSISEVMKESISAL